MSFVHGKKTRLFLHDANLSGYLNSASSSGERDTHDTTVFADDDRNYLGGLGDGTVSLSGLFDGDTDAVHDLLSPHMTSDDPRAFTYAPAGLAVGNKAFLAYLLQGTYEVPSEVAGLVQLNVEGQASGGVAYGTMLTGLQQETSSGSASGHDGGASSSNGLIAHLHVVAASGTTPTLDVKVQESPDGSTWADLVTFDQVSDVDGQRKTTSGSVDRHLRVTWTVGGTDPDFTFVVAVARR